ncbi:MAG: J domain-containing protein [Candidatus Limnocylindrales bacterium]
MAKRDPHDILGVARGASQATIKAAWRKLARQHHPDVAGKDAAAARAATRRMAEINRAYEDLRIGSPSSAGAGGATADGATRRGSGPPKPRPSRPVTARVDTSETFRPRNMTTGPRARPSAPPPLRTEMVAPEPPRASTPTGPLDRGRAPGFRPMAIPDVADAAIVPVEFGKFHGHTLGQIAAFEPSYIDWLARTISHDPELVAAARAIQLDLDRRGVLRRQRPAPVR